MTTDIVTIINAIQATTGCPVSVTLDADGTWSAKTTNGRLVRHSAEGITAYEAVGALGSLIEHECADEVNRLAGALEEAEAVHDRYLEAINGGFPA